MKGKVYRGWRPVLGALAVGLVAFGLSLHGAPAGEETTVPPENGVDTGVATPDGVVGEFTYRHFSGDPAATSPRHKMGRKGVVVSFEPVGGNMEVGGRGADGRACECDAECGPPAGECRVARCVDNVCDNDVLADVGVPCELDGLFCTREECHAVSGGADVVCEALYADVGNTVPLSPCSKECVGGDNAGRWCYEASDCPAPGQCLPKTGVACNDTDDYCHLTNMEGRCCTPAGGCTGTIESACTAPNTWLRWSNPDDTECWCPQYSSGIAPRGDVLVTMQMIVPSWKVCQNSGIRCEGDGSSDCPGYCSIDLNPCYDPTDCDQTGDPQTCLDDACVVDPDACDQNFLWLGDDYSLTGGSAIRLNEFRFRGGVNNSHEAVFFEIWDDDAGSPGTYVGGWYTTFSQAGIGYYTIDLDCYPGCDTNPDNLDYPDPNPLIIPENGWLVLRSSRDTAGIEQAIDYANAAWCSTDVVDVGTNNANKLLWWDTGSGNTFETGDYDDGVLDPDVMIFEFVGQPVDNEGACCVVEGRVACENTPRWGCGNCTITQLPCSQQRDCGVSDEYNCVFKNWFGPYSHEEYVTGDGILCEDEPTLCDTGACCDAGECTPGVDKDVCETGGGFFLGFGQDCEPNCCPVELTGGDAACDTYLCWDTALGDWVDPYDECGPSDIDDPPDPDCDAGQECLLACPGPVFHQMVLPVFDPEDPMVSYKITFMGDSSLLSPDMDDYFGWFDGDSCNVSYQYDVGWYEGFEIINDTGNPLYDCAVVNLDACCSDPLRDPVYSVVKDCCPCPLGGCWVTPDQDEFGNTMSGYTNNCFAEECCEDGNWAGTYTMAPGKYTWLIPAGGICENTTYDCETDDDCQTGQICVDHRGPYIGHISVRPCIPAACCVPLCDGGPNDGLACDSDDFCADGLTEYDCVVTCEQRNMISCLEDGGDWLGLPNFDPIIPDCASDYCGTGSCCVGAECFDDPLYDTEIECEEEGGIYHGYLSCDDDPCAVCPFEIDANCKESSGSGFIIPSDRSGDGTGEFPQRVADDFIPAGTQISQVCWSPAYYGGNDDAGQFECADPDGANPPPPDNWEYAIYEDNAGIPGAVVSSGDIDINVKEQRAGNSRVWDYWGDLETPVGVTNGACYWLEITGLGEGEDGCHTYWSDGDEEGNLHCMRDRIAYGVYGAEDIDNIDMQFCLDSGLQGDSDCGTILASCCTCGEDVCQPDLSQAVCEDQTPTGMKGVWQLGKTCGEAACPTDPPPNEECEDAIAVTNAGHCSVTTGTACSSADDCPPTEECVFDDVVLAFNNICCERNNPPGSDGNNLGVSCGQTGDLRYDVWYKYTAPATGVLDVSMCIDPPTCDGALWDTMLAIYDQGVGCDPFPGGAPYDNEIACHDDDCDSGGPSAGTVQVFDGQEYLVRIGGWSSLSSYWHPRGHGEVNFSFEPIDIPVATPEPAGAPHDCTMDRYLAISPDNNGATPITIKVTMVASDYFGDAVPIEKWVGASFTPPGVQWDPGDLVADLIDAEPPARVFNEALLLLTDCAVVPASTYEIVACVPGACSLPPLVLQTTPRPGPKYFGDIVGAAVGGAWLCPNAVMNIGDIQAGLQTMSNVITAPHPSRVEVHDIGPNYVVNIADILVLVKAFKGEEYVYGCLDSEAADPGDVDPCVADCP